MSAKLLPLVVWFNIARFIMEFIRPMSLPHALRGWFADHLPRFAVYVVGIGALLHLLVAGRFDLSVDEAHYALYGLKPDWSYFDHPPMVGWLQALALHLGSSEFVLRLWPVLLNVVGSWALYGLARELFPTGGRRLGALAVLLLQSALVFQVIAVGLVPEDPLLVFALIGALFLYRALLHNRPRDWLVFGLALGLAGLSKYTAITVAVGALIALLAERRWGLLRGPWPWVAMALAVLLISPVLYWNHLHDWISFRYQLGHGAPDRPWQWRRFLTAEAGQLLAYGPLLVFAGLAAVVVGFRERAHPGVRFSLALALPTLLLFAFTGGYEETLPHWTLIGWALLSPLTAWWLLGTWGLRRVRVLTWVGGGYSLLLSLLILSVLFTPWIPFAPYKHPLGDLIGWRQAAQRAKILAEEQPAAARTLYVGNWSLASRIAWYARPLPVQVTDRRVDQFDLWYGSPQPGEGGILIVPEYYAKTPFSGLARFHTCTPLDKVPVSVHGRPVHTFTLYRCSGYLGP